MKNSVPHTFTAILYLYENNKHCYLSHIKTDFKVLNNTKQAFQTNSTIPFGIAM